MPSKDSQTRLTARQRLGWLVILLLMFASLAALIWRSKPAPKPPQVLEWPIAPIVADSTADSAGTAPSARIGKPKRGKRKKPERRKSVPSPKPEDAPRDITAEDVATPPARQ